MAKQTAATIAAKILVLGHASGWLHDQLTGEASSDIFLNSQNIVPPEVLKEGFALCKSLRRRERTLILQLKKMQE